MHASLAFICFVLALDVVCHAVHYEKPPCQSDETSFSIAGSSDSSVCAPPCGPEDACPEDTPPGTTVKPRCALKDQSGKKYCALTCIFGHCPTGAKCVRPAGAIVGYCAYETASEPTEIAEAITEATNLVSLPKFMWLHTHVGEPVITFGEVAGAAGELPSDSGNTSLWTQADSRYTNRTQLSLQRKDLGGGTAELVAEQPLAPAPYLLELSYDSSDTRYYANADRVSTPNDWFPIQNSARSMLDITLRDPYIKHAATAGAADLLQTQDSVDQCPRGAAWHLGDACLIAVVRFNNSLVASAVNVTTYGADGQPLRTAFLPASAMGVAIVRLPVSSTNVTFASVIFQDGTVEHAATTSVVLQR